MSGPESRRDFFAAHAPREIPHWFVVPGHEKPLPAVPSVRDALKADPRFLALPEATQSAVLGWSTDPCFELETAALQAIGQTAFDVVDEARAKSEAAEIERRRVRFFLWPWYYADRLIKAGGPVPQLI